MTEYFWEDWPNAQNVAVRTPMEIPSDEKEREELSKDPYQMLQVALSRREKLPDDLHQAMMVWSFHPQLSYTAKMYVEWLDFLNSCPQPTTKSFWPPFSLFERILNVFKNRR